MVLYFLCSALHLNYREMVIKHSVIFTWQNDIDVDYLHIYYKFLLLLLRYTYMNATFLLLIFLVFGLRFFSLIKKQCIKLLMNSSACMPKCLQCRSPQCTAIYMKGN